jgi:CRISPR-associated endonuclease Csn1
MGYVLGLDIGSNSVGWAAIDVEKSQLLGMGVRVFPEGVDREPNGAEKAKNQGRREARGHRRQIARRARRKSMMRRALYHLGWWDENAPESVAQALAADPWELRARGLDEQLSLAEFGRVLLHLAQRRGFLSNRKADRGKKDERSETLQEISGLEQAIKDSGARTLGEYLHWVGTGKVLGSSAAQRRRHTRRQMFLDEFELLWASQQRFHSEILTDLLKYGALGQQNYPCDPVPLRRSQRDSPLARFGFHGLLFFQRSLYWPASVVGRCELEPRQKRCERADRNAQRFRLLNEVNNLRIIPQLGAVRSLTQSERGRLIAFLERRKEADFSAVRKKLALLDGDTFNLEAGDRRKLQGMPTDTILAGRRFFGERWWDLSVNQRDEIVRALIEDEAEQIQKKAPAWGCNAELTQALCDLDITATTSGYSSLSLVAIRKLLPHLEAGLPLTAKDSSASAMASAGYLRADQRTVPKGQWLPLPSDRIVNPLVRQALFQVRKLVHAVIREWGMPQSVHIELAREVQGSAEQRSKASEQMRKRERTRVDAARFVEQFGFHATRDAINRVLLWREQGETCLYSGQPISALQLLGGEVDIDHILPYSRSLDDSMMNKAVVFRHENAQKGNRTVAEWLEDANPTKYEQVLQNARRLPPEIRSRKLLKLKAANVEIESFINRQLTDTAYITTQVMDLMRHLQGVDIVAVKGQTTAELRHMWGLNSVLRDDGLQLKNREDHRHHAVDALVIALTNRSTLQQLARIRGTSQQLQPPFADFSKTVRDVINQVIVSHRAVRDLAGPLHEETIYGATAKPERRKSEVAERGHAKGWKEEDGVFVVRKPLTALSLNEVAQIRDQRVREIVEARLAEFGLRPGRKDASEDSGTATGTKIPPVVWEKPIFVIGSKKGPDRRVPNPIRKVRVLRNEKTIRPIRGGEAHVKPGNTHHIAIFELPAASNGKRRREMVSITMIEATQLASAGLPLISQKHPTNSEAKFLFSLCSGECVEGEIGGRSGVFVFRTAASTTGQIFFRVHCDSRKSASAQKFRANANTLKCRKVTVDLLGRVRYAND